MKQGKGTFLQGLLFFSVLGVIFIMRCFHLFQLVVSCLAVLVATAGQVQAGVITYTDKTSFMAALASSSMDNFDNLPAGFFAGPHNRTVGAYTYQATAVNGFYRVGSGSDSWLSTNIATDPIEFTINAGGPTAIGGFFFATNLSGALTNSTVSVSINGGLFGQSVSTNSATNFFGWVSTDGTQISSLRVSTTDANTYPTVNDLILGQANFSAVPEPTSLAMFGIGASVAGITAARRRRREKQQKTTA